MVPTVGIATPMRITAGRLVRPDVSRARRVTEYVPGPRKRATGVQCRVYTPHGRGGTSVVNRRVYDGTPGRESVARIVTFLGESSQIRKRT